MEKEVIHWESYEDAKARIEKNEGEKPLSDIVYTEPADYFPKELREKYKLGEYAEPPCLERIRAVMLGHAVGDALGVPVEFCSRRELDEDPVVDMRGFGTYAVPAGSWSDDTSMSLAALDSLGMGKIDWDDIMRRFGAWLESGAYTPTGETFDAGRTCTRAILNYFAKQLPPTACGGTGEHSNGNGSLMRIHPFVLYAAAKRLPFAEAMQTVDLASSLTHAHERSRIACGIYTILLLRLWEQPDKAAIRGVLSQAAAYYASRKEAAHYQRIFTPDFEKLPRDAIKSSGYVVDTLEAALWCLLTTDSYRDCVLTAVNLGGDTDTVAAIAGGIAGALYGTAAIPAEWLATLKRRDYVDSLCTAAATAWTAPRPE